MRSTSSVIGSGVAATSPDAPSPGLYYYYPVYSSTAGCVLATTSAQQTAVTSDPLINTVPALDNCACVVGSNLEGITTVYASGGGTAPYTFAAVTGSTDVLKSVIDNTGASHPGASSPSGVKGVFMTLSDGLSQHLQCNRCCGLHGYQRGHNSSRDYHSIQSAYLFHLFSICC